MTKKFLKPQFLKKINSPKQTHPGWMFYLLLSLHSVKENKLWWNIVFVGAEKAVFLSFFILGSCWASSETCRHVSSVTSAAANVGPHRRASLTGIEEDHGLEADVLLPRQLELSHSGRGGDQHVKDLHEALDAAALLPATHKHTHIPLQTLVFMQNDSGQSIYQNQSKKSKEKVRKPGENLIRAILNNHNNESKSFAQCRVCISAQIWQ